MSRNMDFKVDWKSCNNAPGNRGRWKQGEIRRNEPSGEGRVTNPLRGSKLISKQYNEGEFTILDLKSHKDTQSKCEIAHTLTTRTRPGMGRTSTPSQGNYDLETRVVDIQTTTFEEGEEVSKSNWVARTTAEIVDSTNRTRLPAGQSESMCPKPTQSCIKQHLAEVGECFRSFFTRNVLTDVNIHIDETTFTAHKAVLIAHSQYFKKAITNTDPRALLEIEAIGLSPSSFQVILQYMYTAELVLTIENIADLHATAQQLEMKKLLDECEKVWNTLDAEDALLIIITATNRESDIYQRCIDVVERSFREVVNSPRLAKLDMDILMELLTSDRLVVNTEMDVFIAAVEWTQHDTRRRSIYVKQLLTAIRFCYMTPKELLSCTKISKSLQRSLRDSMWYSVTRQYNRETNMPITLPPKRQYQQPLSDTVMSVRSQKANEILPNKYQITAKEPEKCQELPPCPRSMKNTDALVKIKPPEAQSPVFPSQDNNIFKSDSMPLKSSFNEQLPTAGNKSPKRISFTALPEVLSVHMHLLKSQPIVPTNALLVKSPPPKSTLKNGGSCATSEVGEPSEEGQPEKAILIVGGAAVLARNDPKHKPEEDGRLIYAYTPSDKNLKKVGLLPEARHLHNVAFLMDCLYVVGGVNPEDKFENYPIPTDSVDKWSLRSQRWSKSASMFSPRLQHGLTKLNNRIYALGGQDHNGRVLNTVEVYNPGHDSWRKLAPLSVGRIGMGVTSYKGRIMVAGGFKASCTNYSGKPILSTVEVYNPATDIWTMKKNLMSPRFHHALLEADGYIYACGGATSKENGKNEMGVMSVGDVEKYNVKVNKWGRVHALTSERHGAPAVAIDTKIYIIGGVSSVKRALLRNIECLDLKTGTSSCTDVDNLCIMGMGVAICDAELLKGDYFNLEKEDPA